MQPLVWTVALLAACGGSTPMTSPGDGASDDDALQAGSDAPLPAHLVAYVSGYSTTIAWFDVDLATGALAPAGTIASFAASPSFLATTQTHLYAASEATDKVGAYAIDQATGALTFVNDAASGGDGPAHVSVDHTGKFVMVANYGDGKVAVLPVRADGGVQTSTQTPLAGQNAHMILTDPANKFVLVPCKGADYVAQYTFSATGALAANSVPHANTADGAGPRHLAFSPDGAHAYLINENTSTLTAFTYDAASGRLAELHTVSARAPNATGTNTGAEVVVAPSGNFVYTSNRGDNTIGVFAIASTGRVTLVGHTPTGGSAPRSFAIDPTGHWMLVANQDSNSVTTFAIDPTAGTLTATGAPVSVVKPSFVGFLSLP